MASLSARQLRSRSDQWEETQGHFSHIPEEIQHTIIGKSIDVNILRHVIRWGQEEAHQGPVPGARR